MKKRGFIGLIILVIIAIVLLRVWFDFDVFKWLNTPEVKGFFMKIWEVIAVIWEKYLREIFHKLVELITNLINRYL